MIDVLDSLSEIAHRESNSLPADVFILRGLWRTSYILRLNQRSTTFHLSYLLAQTVGQGCSYYEHDMDEPVLSESILGKSIFEVATESRPLEIAMLDAAFSSINREVPAKQYFLDGSNIEKADKRAEIISDEILSRLKQQRPKRWDKFRVANVGVVGNILSILRTQRNLELTASDFYRGVVGKSIDGIYVEHGSRTLDLVAEADLAIVTGMTLATDTLDEILKTASEAKTALAIFAETGAHFAHEYCQMGVDIVFSEPFPFYLSGPGSTRIDVYRRLR